MENLVKRYELPIVQNKCEMDKRSKRQEVKDLIKNLSAQYPDLKSKVFGGMQRLPLDGWEPAEYTRRPLP